jgi:maleamate amidohydrolase
MIGQLDENYARAGYNSPLGGGKSPALLMVDLVAAYFVEGSPLYANVDDTLACALRIRQMARNTGVPVIFTNVEYTKGGANGGIFYRKVSALRSFEKGNPLGDFAKGIEVQSDELIVTKQYPSAFFGTSLAATLTAMGVDTVVLTGLTTSGCIRATCIDAVSSGFRPLVVDDACGDRHEEPHKANLFDMNAKYGDVVSETIIAEYFATIQEQST